MLVKAMNLLLHKGHFTRFAIAALLALTAVSCDRINRSAEDRDPNIKRARDRRAVGDYVGAIDSYEKALMKRPTSARIHWEMASIYDQQLTNDLRAIYHYERFLELDPKAERRPYAEQLIAAAKLSYAISLPDRFSDAVNENARLTQEIETLRTLLTESREEVARLNAALAGGAAPARSESQPLTQVQTRAALNDSLQPAKTKVTAMESYVVQQGDTLSRIASKLYGDPNKWDVILEANKNTLKRPENIKVGQTLVIPR